MSATPAWFDETLRLSGRAYGLALRVAGNPALAEDAVQEAFARLLQHPPEPRGPEALRAYFLRTVHNAAVSLLESEAARGRREEAQAVENVRQGAAAVSDPAEKEAALAAQKALAELPVEMRVAVSLCCEQRLTQREAAEITGAPEGTVARRVQRGLELLRERLSAAGYATLGSAALAATLGALGAPAAPASLAAKLAALAAKGALANSAGSASVTFSVAKGGLAVKIIAGVVAAGVLAGATAGGLSAFGHRLSSPPPTANSLPPTGFHPYAGMQEREEVFEFAQKPTATKQGDKVVIAFASKAACDATVAIVGPDGKIVRHLASGVLGKNAPAPFKQGSLSQFVEWDGKDDDGKPAPAGCKVKVSLGLKAEFDKIEKQDLFSAIKGLAVDKEGQLYMAMANGILSESVQVLDRQGKLVRTIWPPSGAVPPERLSLLTWNKTAKGQAVPMRNRYGGGWSFDLMSSSNRDFFASAHPHTSAAAPDGRVVFLSALGGKGGSRLVFLEAKDGSCPPGSFVDLGQTNASHLALSPDGKWLYFSGKVAFHGSPGASHAVMRMALDKPGAPKIFAGEVANSGADNTHFNAPTGVACDKDGNVYVGDTGNKRIQVHKPDGSHLKTIPDVTAGWLAVHPKTGAIYVCEGHNKAKNGTVVAKLGGLDNPARTAELSIPKPKVPWEGLRDVVLALDPTSDPPALWLCARDFGPVRIEDRGDKLAQTVDAPQANGLSAETGEGNGALSSHQYVLEADKRTGQLVDGVRGPDGLVYSRGQYYSSQDTCVFRFKPGGDPSAWKKLEGVSFDVGVPAFASRPLEGRAPLMQDGKPVIGIPMVKTDGGGGHGFQSPFCVAPNGDIYITTTLNTKHFPELEKAGYTKPARWGAASHILQVYAPSGKPKSLCALAELADADGLRVGKSGAVYIVLGLKPLDQKGVPDGLAAGSKYDDSRWGSLIKFNGNFEKFPVGRIEGVWGKQALPNATHSLAGNPTRMENAHWSYGGVSPISAHYSSCSCLKSSFDLDLYERSFVPAAQTCSINVIDANGNVAARLGGYGNIHDLAIGKPPAFDIPRSVAVTDEALWVHDCQHRAVIKAKLSYAAEETVPAP